MGSLHARRGTSFPAMSGFSLFIPSRRRGTTKATITKTKVSPKMALAGLSGSSVGLEMGMIRKLQGIYSMMTPKGTVMHVHLSYTCR